MQITCASALPSSGQGKPSKASQRMQVLERVGQAVLLVEQDAQRQVERMDALRGQLIVERLDARLVRHRLVRERAARCRLARVLATLAVDVEQALGLGVVRLEGVVRQRPCRRDPVDMRHGTEVALAKAQQRRAVDLGIAADVIVQPRVERLAVLSVPGLGGLVTAMHEDFARAPVRGLARQVVAPLEDQDPLAAGGEPLRQGAAPGAAADDDQVVVISHLSRSRDRASCRHRRRASSR